MIKRTYNKGLKVKFYPEIKQAKEGLKGFPPRSENLYFKEMKGVLR